MATEEQTTFNSNLSVRAGQNEAVVQELLIANRIVSKLSLRLYKAGSPPAEDITYEIRRVGTPGDVLASKVQGKANVLSAVPDWVEVIFDAPVLINEIVRIGVSFNYGDASNRVKIEYNTSSVKANEETWVWTGVVWTELSAGDTAYIYTYEAPAVGGGQGGPAALVAARII